MLLYRFLFIFLFAFSVFNITQACDPKSSGVEDLKIHLVAPSAKVNMDLAFAFKDLLEAKGATVNLSDDFQDAEVSSFKYCSNSDEARAQFFLDALLGDSNVIWALRGGYGAQAVVRSLDEMRDDVFCDVDLSRKTFVGFSDATVLGLYLKSRFGVRFIHGPMYYVTETAERFGVSIGSETSVDRVLDILNKRKEQLVYDLTPLNDIAKSVHLDAKIIGGNLSLIQRNLFGLLRNVDFSSALFIEDTSEDVKRLWDILCGVFDTGRFDSVEFVIFGRLPMTGGEPDEFLGRFSEFLKKKFARPIPLFQSNVFGHGTKNEPLVMGARISIDEGGKTFKMATFLP